MYRYSALQTVIEAREYAAEEQARRDQERRARARARSRPIRRLTVIIAQFLRVIGLVS